LIRRLPLVPLLILFFKAAPIYAAFEAFSDLSGHYLLAVPPNSVGGEWCASLIRTDRYGLPELGTNFVGITKVLPNRYPGSLPVIGITANSMGDKLYSENRLEVSLSDDVNKLFPYVNVKAGVQSVRIKDYGSRGHFVMGGALTIKPLWNLPITAGVDGVALPGGRLPVSAATPIGWVSIYFMSHFSDASFGFEVRSKWSPQIFVRFTHSVSKRLQINMIWQDRPGRIGGGLGYSINRYTFAISYAYQPIIGTTRRLGFSVGW